MKKSLFYFILVLISSSLFNCGKPVVLGDVEVKEAEPKLVVFGVIDNSLATHDSVILSKSVSLYEIQNGNTPVLGATVSISYGDSTIELIDSKNKGIYFAPTWFKGKPNQVYTLKINSEGKLYSATSILPTLLKDIHPDSVVYKIEYEFKKKERPYKTDGYVCKYWSSDPADEENYYLFRHYRNDSIMNSPDWGGPGSVQFYNYEDKWIKPNLDGLEFPNLYQLNDKLKLDVLSITKEVFSFYNDANNQMNGAGLFSTPPANAKGNISNGALGIFQCSSFSRDTLTIKLK